MFTVRPGDASGSNFRATLEQLRPTAQRTVEGLECRETHYLRVSDYDSGVAYLGVLDIKADVADRAGGACSLEVGNNAYFFHLYEYRKYVKRKAVREVVGVRTELVFAGAIKYQNGADEMHQKSSRLR